MTIDDILDSDIDAQVERTNKRAIFAQRAWLFFALQALIGVSLAYTRYAYAT